MPHLLRRALAAPLIVLLPAMCASCDDDSTAASDPPSGDYRVSVDNCGHDVDIDGTPQRIVTIKSSATEMALALGAGDRIVGTAFADGPVPDEFADEAESVDVISDGVPSSESILALEPDLVYGGWESNFAAEGAGDRGELADLGVATYVSPSACKDEAYQPDELAFEDVFAEIEQAGRVLGEPDAAKRLVAEQRKQLARIPRSDAGLSALWYSSGTDVPYVGAGTGAPAMVMKAVGLDNVAGDIDDTWTSLSWEAIADRDPDVIVLVDASWNTAESKIDMLESDPLTSRLSAVRHERYLRVPFAASEAGVRNVDAVHDLARQLAEYDHGAGS